MKWWRRRSEDEDEGLGGGATAAVREECRVVGFQIPVESRSVCESKVEEGAACAS